MTTTITIYSNNIISREQFLAKVRIVTLPTTTQVVMGWCRPSRINLWFHLKAKCQISKSIKPSSTCRRRQLSRIKSHNSTSGEFKQLRENNLTHKCKSLALDNFIVCMYIVQVNHSLVELSREVRAPLKLTYQANLSKFSSLSSSRWVNRKT